MALERMFSRVKVELKQYIIDHPKVCILELRVVFNWSIHQEKIMMMELRKCAGINGNGLFLFETRRYYNKDSPGKYPRSRVGL